MLKVNGETSDSNLMMEFVVADLLFIELSAVGVWEMFQAIRVESYIYTRLVFFFSLLFLVFSFLSLRFFSFLGLLGVETDCFYWGCSAAWHTWCGSVYFFAFFFWDAWEGGLSLGAFFIVLF